MIVFGSHKISNFGPNVTDKRLSGDLGYDMGKTVDASFSVRVTSFSSSACEWFVNVLFSINNIGTQSHSYLLKKRDSMFWQEFGGRSLPILV